MTPAERATTDARIAERLAVELPELERAIREGAAKWKTYKGPKTSVPKF
jgi:hypothetical protein